LLIAIAELDIQPVGAPEYTEVYTTPEQLDEGLLTLSLMPRARWQTLLNLETIRLRNKPKEPPKAPEAAPFFLPTVQGLNPTFDMSKTNGFASGEDDRHVQSQLGFAESDFARRIVAENEDGDCKFRSGSGWVV
jgi:U3 small nucleolar RNA-associated protein 21